MHKGSGLISFVLFCRLSGCPGPCECRYIKGAQSLLSVNCRKKQLKSFPRALPSATAQL